MSDADISRIWGIDPGSRHLAACRADGEVSVVVDRIGKGAKTEGLGAFIGRVVNSLEREFACEEVIVAIEHQFDKSPGKPLERIQHILEWELGQGHSRTVLRINPSSFKIWVCDVGNAKESLLWPTIEQNRASGKYPSAFKEIVDEHVTEAGLMGLMVSDWIAHGQGRSHGLHGYTRGLTTVRPAW